MCSGVRPNSVSWLLPCGLASRAVADITSLLTFRGQLNDMHHAHALILRCSPSEEYNQSDSSIGMVESTDLPLIEDEKSTRSDRKSLA